MNRIRLLSEQVANQIAAGEVVERPASVVKELVENALDADASKITVEIQAGGRSLIRVTDDGFGMSRDDALLSLERHATSKIQKAEDLSAISTMGFRGEALPSIASVSRFVLTSRERNSDSLEASQVIVHGGRIQEVKTAGAPQGSSVEVRQLFFNLPARKKFLRSEETEFSHIQHTLTLAALAHPKVGFTLIKDGRTIWQLPPASAHATTGPLLPALKERLKSLLGDDSGLIPLEFVAELPEISSSAMARDADAYSDLSSRTLRLWGFIGKPGVSRSTRDQHYIFVNRRPVENRGINFALMEGYHTALMKGRYPVCCLFLEIDPARVDVNIHPTKREVKFHQESEIRRLVAEGVREALLQFHEIGRPRSTAPAPAMTLSETAETQPGLSLDLGSSTSVANSRATAPSRPSEPSTTSYLATEGTSARVTPTAPPTLPPALWTSPAPATAGPTSESADHVFSTKPSTSAPARAPEVFASTASSSNSFAQPVPLLQQPLRILGVLGRLYVLMESSRGMVVMDQHAAHERILFEQMLNRLEQGHAASQRLLLPETVELSSRDAEFVREILPSLTRLGVGLSEFGERTFLLDGLPPFVKSPDAHQFVVGLIDELKSAGQSVNNLRLGEDVIAKTVCRHAVKANDPLKGPELEGLLLDLKSCSMPYTCPHGRPTLIEITHREFEKRFGRMQ